VTIPTIVIKIPFDSDGWLASIDWTALAASSPTVSRIWSAISPRAAGSPHTAPAMATTTSSSGDSDRAV
jgi:hypothetical protein